MDSVPITASVAHEIAFQANSKERNWQRLQAKIKKAAENGFFELKCRRLTKLDIHDLVAGGFNVRALTTSGVYLITWRN